MKEPRLSHQNFNLLREDRVTATPQGVEESPGSTGQGAR